MVRIIPTRLKTSNGKSNIPVPAQPNSRGQSPLRDAPAESSGLILRTSVIKARNLAAKDRSGTSDPFLTLTLGEVGQSTPFISKNLNPEWNVTFDLPLVNSQSLLLQAVCWDKDRFRNDFMGEFNVAVEDIFADANATQEPKWYTLKAPGAGKKSKTSVSGEVLLKFVLVDTTDLLATPQDLIRKLAVLTAPESGDEQDDEEELLAKMSSADLEDEDDEDDEDGTGSDEKDLDQDGGADGLSKPETAEKRKKRLRMKRLRRKTIAQAYEFSGGSDVVGIVFLEIVKITDLPPERNMTRTSFDMDPFVVVSIGRKTFRTRVIRHNLNPVFEEKMVFQVMRHEQNYSMSLNVVDRDKLSGNDFVGTANFPLVTLTACAPQADSDTGLYSLPEPSDVSPSTAPSNRSRFRIPISRTSSASSINKPTKPTLTTRSSHSSLQAGASTDSTLTPLTAGTQEPGSLSPLSIPSNVGNTPIVEIGEDIPDPLLKQYILSLPLKNKDRWEDKHNPQIYIRAKYLPYSALRQQFWRAMLRQYDSDENARISKVELTTMLDSLGSTLRDSTINNFFRKYASGLDVSDPSLTFDQAVMCLEERLQQTSTKTFGDKLRDLAQNVQQSTEAVTQKVRKETVTPERELCIRGSESSNAGTDETADEDLHEHQGEEHVVEIRECPLCHQPRLNKKSEADIVTHIATCASQDWRQVNNIVMAGFVTSSQAQRKWYSKVINKVSYGGYKLGANSANILVQDRITGQINEERMSVYVRLGIRLLYKGLKSREMEKKKIRKMLRNMSVKQGKKYDDPASAQQIQGFIDFHKLDMAEVLRPTPEFKNFNEFFYRELKSDARPCSAPTNPKIIVSPADCRSVVFNTLEDAQKIWVKGREFTVERLLGNAYPEDVKRYSNGALGIFRLAPQDYHRFHIPVDGVLGSPRVIEGEYYTVNPMAIRSTLDVYGENVRVCVPIDSVAHGRVMVICVGAMMVGSTVITRKAGDKVKRAEELGYFKFGGSTILLMFEAGRMRFDNDLIDNASSALETLIRVGMSVGHSPEQSQHLPDMRKEDSEVTNEERIEAKRRIEGSIDDPGVSLPPRSSKRAP